MRRREKWLAGRMCSWNPVAHEHVQAVVFVVEHFAPVAVAGVAGHVISKHQYDVGVWDTHALHSVVHTQRVGDMAVVVPEPGRAHKHCPVVAVAAAGASLCRDKHTQRNDRHNSPRDVGSYRHC